MEPETNPYAAPVAPSSSPSGDHPDANTPTSLSGSLAIDVICFLLLLIVLMSLAQFAIQAMERMPDGELYIAVNPLWVFSHLFRAMCLLFLVWQLFLYGKAIERVETPEDIQALSSRHGRLWNGVATVLLALMAYGAIMVVVAYLRY